MKDLAFNFVTNFVSISGHFRPIAQHLCGDFKFLFHNRRGAFFFGEFQSGFPAYQCQYLRDLFSECYRSTIAIRHTHHGNCRPKTKVAHPVATFAFDFYALFVKRQAINFDNVVEHSSKNRNHFLKLNPIEFCLAGKRLLNKSAKVDGSKQTTTVRGKWLLAARVGRSDIFTEPVVVHLVYFVDEDESRFSEVIGRGHNEIPEPSCLNRISDFAGDASFCIVNVFTFNGKISPHNLGRVCKIDFIRLNFIGGQGKR